MAGKSPTLYSYPDTDTLAPQLRRYVLHCQNAALERHNIFRVAVSGGSLPATLAKALLSPGNGTPDDTPHFSKWEIFFADERAVPLDHDDSNYKLLKDEFLSKIPSGSPMGMPKVHPIDEGPLKNKTMNKTNDNKDADNDDDEGTTQQIADLYQEDLMRSFAGKDAVKLPIFDLILLGCGPDGHTCSLFPGHALLREEHAWVAAETDSPKPPPRRITLTLPVVVHAASIAYVTTGKGKKEILKKIFDQQEEEGRDLPSALVNQLGGEKVSWFTDFEAVEGVAYPKRSNL